jgi:hypothetical protein
MAVDDIESLTSELPDVFAPRTLPPGWDDDWIIIPIGAPESHLPDEEESFVGQLVAWVNQTEDFEAPDGARDSMIQRFFSTPRTFVLHPTTHTFLGTRFTQSNNSRPESATITS